MGVPGSGVEGSDGLDIWTYATVTFEIALTFRYRAIVAELMSTYFRAMGTLYKLGPTGGE